jgi:hypothetical protein
MEDRGGSGYSLVKATSSSFDVQFRRVQSIKRRTTATLPAGPFKSGRCGAASRGS